MMICRKKIIQKISLKLTQQQLSTFNIIYFFLIINIIINRSPYKSNNKIYASTVSLSNKFNSNSNTSKLNTSSSAIDKFNLSNNNVNMNMTNITNINNNNINISKYESSNTLQNSINSWTIGKEERFNTLYKKSLSDGYYNPEFCKSSRACNFGIGDRRQMTMKGVDSLPSPFSYSLPDFIEKNKIRNKGISMSKRIQYKV